MKRKKSKKKNDKQNLKIALFFVFGIFLILFVSFLIKAFAVLKNSKFDGSHRFTIEITGISPTLISFSPAGSSIAEITVEKGKDSVAAKLAIPVDGVVTSERNFTMENPNATLMDMLTHYRNMKTGLTVIDLLRLLLFSRSVTTDNITRKVLKDSDSFDQTEKAIGNLFADQAISSENLAIQVQNAADITGLGNRVGRLISHMGGNVVFITTAEKTADTSKILYAVSKPSYTVLRLSKVLNMPIEQTLKKSLGDVIILLGKDSLKRQRMPDF